ncbi:hypothetical protein [Cellulosilyticum sp. I15G10I2]|uniref:hypothetical protein n=1 Tax=Cellulosilyticum sp. I15G10I2 TaxID=1892843 RepID=UPI00085CC1DB|nr:hypothetical protein [Cellulosilyticum sp. I15G10I2]
MRKSIIKIAVLAMLIVLCIGQMVTLWLGDMSGHNFLGKNATLHNMILVQPKTMWVSTGKLAYKIEESKREYNVLIEEFTNLIAANKKNIKLEKEASITYEDLLSRQGILYEYDLGINLQELVGSGMDRIQDDLAMQQVFIDMSVYNDHKTNLYFITDDLQSIYKIIIYKRLQGHQKMVERFNDPDITRELIGYQPSITSNKRQYIKGNSFLPFITKENPITYEILKVSNPIEAQEGKEKIELLEGYVNSFFSNPLLKAVDEKENGSVIFSENIGAIVKYEPEGTLEFNITSASQETRLSRIERLIAVMEFIEDCRGIPEFLKEGIYLSEIVNHGEAYTYKFNYKYKGFSVHLTHQVKEELGLDNILEITIKNNQVVRGKWSILDIDVYDGAALVTDKVSRGFDEIIDSMYERYLKDKYNAGQLDALQCRYIMDMTEGKLKFNWLVCYEGRWYYP